MLNFTIPSWVYAAVVSLLLAAGCEFHGRHVVQQEFDTYKVAQAVASDALKKQRESEIVIETAKQKKILKETKDEHDKAIRQLDAAYATNRSLRVSAAACSGTSGQTKDGNSKGTDDSNAGTIELPQGVTEGLFKLTERADRIVEQCRALQKVCAEK